MPVEKAALPALDRELLVSLFEAVVRAARPHIASWDDLKTLLSNGAALAVQREAALNGESLVQAAERLQVDVTTLRRNLPPAPQAPVVLARLQREVFRAIDREGRVTMAEIESLLTDSAAVAAARRSRPRLDVADAVVALLQDGFLQKHERRTLPTQYKIADANPVLQQMGQDGGDWMDGISTGVALVIDAAIKQARLVSGEAFGRKMRQAHRVGEDMPVPAEERMPWFFVNRPAHLSTHECNERFAAAIRNVIEQMDGERGEGNEGTLMHLCLAMNHSFQQDGAQSPSPNHDTQGISP